jgi:xanthine dehydrogenase accessory factor
MQEAAQLLRQGLAWQASGRKTALAVVLSTWGSAPRPPGSLMVIADDGAMAGSVSAGCVEGATLLEAQKMFADGEPRRLSFSIGDERAWDVGLGCGGKLEIYLEPLDGRATLAERLCTAMQKRQPTALFTDLTTGQWVLIDAQGRCHGDAAPAPACLDQVLAALSARTPCRLTPDQEAPDRPDCFINVFPPALRLVIVGAGHLAQALTRLAIAAEIDVAIIDPRPTFAHPDRFPGAQILLDWPQDALPGLVLDQATAIVTLSHDPKFDDPALMLALDSSAFYIGALGSRATHAKRLARLGEQGVPANALARIRGPVGLPLGAIGAYEIAIAILADIILAWRGPKTVATHPLEEDSDGISSPAAG